MKLGLVGNLTIYVPMAAMFGYMFWEFNNMKTRMAQIDDDHPINEIFKGDKYKELRASAQVVESGTRKGRKIPSTTQSPQNLFEMATKKDLPAPPPIFDEPEEQDENPNEVAYM
eukprot:TRINITY_DN4813_c0_g1_i1.p1 TRINITY_DN4813_c0_g1~~TRINITY_DN4813_c0_g1_i1.p1  ORF type:complete len:114 (+),score=30.79 TRINITY_DN4813_c0_g1_i1:68-409(+)